MHTNRNWTITLTLLLALAFTFGCSDDTSSNNNNTPKQDTGSTTADKGSVQADAAATAPPSASFKVLKPYSSVKGSASLEATVTGTAAKLELLADGKTVATLTTSPWTFTWDTSALADGVMKLSIKATNSAGSKTSTETPVVVLNKGSEISWKAGNSGTVIVPTTGYVDQHLRYHWDMLAGVTKIITVLTWDKPGFKMELALGMGTCPHSGTTAIKKESETSPLLVSYPETGTAALTTGQWFAHVQLMNGTSVLGQQTPFKVIGYLLK